MSSQNSKSFTLIELLITLAIIAILATILILTIKPGIFFARARDTQRIGDLKNIEKIIDALYSTEYTFYELNYASSNVVYISLPDSSSTCGSYLSQLPSLPSGWSYHCSATPTNIDGSGWIPIPFSNFPILNISQLPIDPRNDPPYYYSFVAGGSYEVTAVLEADSNKGPDTIGGKDGGDHNFVYEAGINKKLTPSSIQVRAEPDSLKQGLVGWWTFDEGTGTTTKDLSGNGNNGTLLDASSTNADGNTPPQWTTGKVGDALSFDGVDDYVNVENPSSGVLDFGTSSFSYSMWVNFDVGGDVIGSWQLPFWKGGSSYGYAGYDFEFSESSNRLDANISDGSGGYAKASYSYNFRDGTWHYIVAVVDRASNTITLFVDAIQRGQTTISTAFGSVSNSYSLIIGSPSFPFDGFVDEVRVYNRALSDSEIKVLYDAAK
jgi:prepilin-type N-terminal cleavage/methylation domain-containing protein